jgi:hypothetical protein
MTKARLIYLVLMISSFVALLLASSRGSFGLSDGGGL